MFGYFLKVAFTDAAVAQPVAYSDPLLRRDNGCHRRAASPHVTPWNLSTRGSRYHAVALPRNHRTLEVGGSTPLGSTRAILDAWHSPDSAGGTSGPSAGAGERDEHGMKPVRSPIVAVEMVAARVELLPLHPAFVARDPSLPRADGGGPS